MRSRGNIVNKLTLSNTNKNMRANLNETQIKILLNGIIAGLPWEVALRYDDGVTHGLRIPLVVEHLRWRFPGSLGLLRYVI